MSVTLPTVETRPLPEAPSLEDLVAALPVAMVVTEAEGDGRVLFANRAAVEGFGIDPADVGTLRAVDFYADPAERQRLLGEIRRAGQIDNFEVRLRAADGRPVDVLVSARLLRQRGRPVLLVAFQDIGRRKRAEETVRRLLADLERANAELEARVEERTRALSQEITERIRAEAALRESEQRLKAVLEAGSDWFWATGPDHRFIGFSGRLKELLGVDPETLIGTSRPDLSAESLDQDKWRAHRETLARREPFRDFTYRLRLPDGSVRFLRTTGAPVFGQDGEFLGYRGIASDETEALEAQHRLEENRRLLRAVIDAVPAAINVKDRQSRLVLLNRFQAEIFGTTPRDAIGRTTAELVGEGHGAESRAYELQVLATGRPVPFVERDFSGAAGKPLILFSAKMPLKDDDGTVQNIVTAALDITQLKATERARANLARYFAPNMVGMLANADEPFGPARSQTVAVLFADIVGFTHLCEELPPEAVFHLLRDFQARLAEVVFDCRGTLDKYTGDGMMATFGTPQPGPHDATDALRCARRMRRMLAAWNDERRAMGEREIRVGIGLHYGPVLLGNIGTERRLEFAAIGDTVNVASRLESLTRPLRADIVASSVLVEAVRAEAAGGEAELEGFVPCAPQPIRGREHALAVWMLPAQDRPSSNRPPGESAGEPAEEESQDA